MEFTSLCEVTVAPGKGKVSDKVANIVAATEGKDDFPADIINGYVRADSEGVATGVVSE